MIFSILSMLVFLIGLTYLLIQFKIPTSLSQSYYNLENKKKDSGILFYIYLSLISLLAIVPAIDLFGLWGFLFCVGLLFVATAPAFKEESHKYIHIAGTLLTGLSFVVSLFLSTYSWLILIFLLTFLIISLITKTFKSSWIFWLELAVFCTWFLMSIV